jgi:tripartite-type tricarboxylate transporter receptor subunit TctC
MSCSIMSRAAIAAAALVAIAAPASAEWKPKGPIKMMIAFRAGGGADTQARLIAEGITKAKGWKIIPQATPGAGGITMARKLKNEPKDGLSIGILINETFAYNMLATKKPGFSEKDFTMLTTISGSQMGMIAKKDRGWKTFADVLAEAKKGKVFKAGAMSQKLADGLYVLAKANNVKFNTVMFKGGKGVLDAVVAGDVDFGWAAGIQVRGVRAGDLVNLMSGETTKLKISPDAPLAKEFGADFDFGANFMFVAPAGIPADAREALTRAISDAATDKDSKANKFIVRAFGAPKIISGAALDKLIADSIKQSQALLKASGG